MDITDNFLPGEKFLKQYDEVYVDRGSGFSIVMTNLRMFIANKNELWDLQTDKIDYLGRAFIPRFSWWWQLIFIPLAMISVSNPMFFGLFLLLSVARQYVRIEALVVGIQGKEWKISKDTETIQLLIENIRSNSIVGLERKDGKQILEADLIDGGEIKNLELTLVGENESRVLKLAWIFATLSFLSYYMGSFRLGTSFWTFLFAATSFGFFILHRDKRKTNQFRGVEPSHGWTLSAWIALLKFMNIEYIKANWSFKILDKKFEVRQLGYHLFCICIFLGLILTVSQSSMIPLLQGISIGTTLYLIGRVLAGIPRDNWRMGMRATGAAVVAITIVLPCLALIPLYETSSVMIPKGFIQGDSGNGWKNMMDEYDEYGLGLAASSYVLYADDGMDQEENQDGYPALLFVVAIKIPFNLEEENMLSILDDQFREMAIDQEIDLDSQIEQGSRLTKQGYSTQYSIYNGTAKTEEFGFGQLNRSVTKGSESRYIGEVWKAPEYDLIVVAMGIAIISEEEINEQTGVGPVDDIIDLIPNNPNDTTDIQNWNELLELIPETVCYQT